MAGASETTGAVGGVAGGGVAGTSGAAWERAAGLDFLAGLAALEGATAPPPGTRPMRRGAASPAASAAGLGAAGAGLLLAVVSDPTDGLAALSSVRVRLRAGTAAAAAGPLLLEAASTTAGGRAGESTGFSGVALRLRVGAALATAAGPLPLETAVTSATTLAVTLAVTLRAVFLAATLVVGASGIGAAVAAAAAFLVARLRAGAGATPLAVGVDGWGRAKSLLVIRDRGWRVRLAQGGESGSWGDWEATLRQPVCGARVASGGGESGFELV